MILGDDEVVHHAGIGRLEAVEARHLAGGRDGAEGEGGRKGPGGVVAEEHHLAGHRIDLRMRGERPGDGAAIIAVAARCERARLDLGRQMAFFQREQAAAMRDDVGVGDAAVGRARPVRPAASGRSRRTARGRRRARPAIWGCGPSGCDRRRGRLSRWKACSMPSPTNQCAPGESNCGLGPLR